MKRAGFTLLEVLVAIAILGLSLTVILGAQVGSFASAQRAERLSAATDLARCKMAETELYLVQWGYPLTDSSYDGPCCDDQDDSTFSCEWKVERVVLPELAPFGVDTASTEDTQTGDALGPLGVLADLQKSGGASLGESPSLEALGEQVSESAGGISGMTQMLFGFVYPNLKPMLEASVRRVTVSVKWREGKVDRDLTVSQYVTDPQKGGFEGETEEKGATEP